jgi:hypothetical protein
MNGQSTADMSIDSLDLKNTFSQTQNIHNIAPDITNLKTNQEAGAMADAEFNHDDSIQSVEQVMLPIAAQGSSSPGCRSSKSPHFSLKQYSSSPLKNWSRSPSVDSKRREQWSINRPSIIERF